MSHTSNVSPYSANSEAVRAELSEIDLSIRNAALFFVVSAVIWLMLGTIFALIAAFKAHDPDFASTYEFLTFGRVRSAHLNAMSYGWGNNIIFAVGLWMMARLCRTPIRHRGMLLIAGVFWNIGLTVGVFGILKGDITSVEWLEMPKYATPLLAISYALIGVWGILAFRFRRAKHVYVSQWYILAALFWFPWLYIVAQTFTIWFPGRGVVQAITNWWFAHNVLGLWLTPMALAAAYYLIPKVLGRPVYSYYLSVLGFWTLAIFYNWAGVHHLIGGPIPAWILSAAIVASVMMVVPVIVVGINHHMSVVGLHREVWRSPTLRFIVFGAISYTLVSLAGSTMALRTVNEITHFTHFTIGHSHHGLYAFFTMTMFGAVYYMMPRLLRREWPSAGLIKLHFWAAAIGITIMIVALHVGGWIQGLEMNNPEIPFMETVRNTIPWLKARSISGLTLTVGHVAFAVNIFWMFFGSRRPEPQEGPTLLSDSEKGGTV